MASPADAESFDLPTPRLPVCGSVRGEAALLNDKKLRSKLKQGKWQMEA
jgi:hypothetical protein